jgi:hypothetical protein
VNKKFVIVSMLVGGMWGHSSLPSMQPAIAQSAPTVPQVTESTNNNISKLELLDAGAEPRQEVKFRPLANSKQTMTMTMGMSMDMAMGETPLPKTNIPKIVIKIDLTVGEVEASGDIHYSFSYTDLNAIADNKTSPELTAAIQKSFNTLKGIRGDLVVSSTGQVKSQKLILPKTIDPMTKQTLDQFTKSIEQLSTRLPSNAVGLGAKWQTTHSVTMAGLQLSQAATYEVIAIDARGMTVKCKVAQSAPPQDLLVPGAAANGAKIKLDSLNSSGGGTYVVLFDSLFPLSGKLSSLTESKMSVQINAKEPSTNITSKIAIDLDLTAR